MSEPIYQWSGFFLDESGNKDQFVFRIYEQIPPEEYMEQLAGFKAQIAANGYSPVSVGSVPVGASSSGPEKEYDDSFEAGAMVKSVMDGKTYWKVSGKEGQFPKFPVAIWPEVIERDLCPMEELTADSYPLDGYVAHFEKNDKGNPRKVIKLVKDD